MKKLVVFPLSVVLVSALSACSSFKATVLPQQNNTYTAVATSSSYNEALENAVGKANEVCKDQKKKMVILDRSEETKGEDESGMAVAANAAVKIFTLGRASLSGSDSEKNKVSLLFKCE